MSYRNERNIAKAMGIPLEEHLELKSYQKDNSKAESLGITLYEYRLRKQGKSEEEIRKAMKSKDENERRILGI